MIKVNDHKTVEKVIFLMHYHKDWKVRKKNWKRFHKNLCHVWNLTKNGKTTQYRRETMNFFVYMAKANATYCMHEPKNFVIKPSGVKIDLIGGNLNE